MHRGIFSIVIHGSERPHSFEQLHNIPLYRSHPYLIVSCWWAFRRLLIFYNHIITPNNLVHTPLCSDVNESLSYCRITNRFCYYLYKSLVALWIGMRPGSFCLALLCLDQRAGLRGGGASLEASAQSCGWRVAGHWLGVRRVPGPWLIIRQLANACWDSVTGLTFHWYHILWVQGSRELAQIQWGNRNQLSKGGEAKLYCKGYEARDMNYCGH